MTEPLSSPSNDTSSERSGIGSRLARIAYAFATETAWAVSQSYAAFARAIVCFWSLLKQRRLIAKRGAAFCHLGAEIRKTELPAQLLALADDANRLHSEVRRHRDVLTAAGSRWFLRTRSRILLLWARSAHDDALCKLGQAAVGIAPPEHQTIIANLEQAIAREQTRRAQLWEPWRVLPFRRKAEVFIALALFFLAGTLAVHYRLRTNSQRALDDSVRNQPGPAPENAAAGAKNKHELAAGFLKDRNEASLGEWLVYAGNPVLQRGELNKWD